MALNVARCLGRYRMNFISTTTFSIPRSISTTPGLRTAGSRPRVAVVLSGSGVYDGSEIHEASSVLIHLTREGALPAIYAPDIPQMHVIDHSKGSEVEGEKRNVLVEAARIARGAVEPLTSLTAANAEAVIFPGGFGAAKNLSDFATQGRECKVHPDVARVIKDFNQAKKPMGFCCIAPILAAKVIPGVQITLGQPDTGNGEWPYGGAIDAVKAWGASHSNHDVHSVCTDSTHRIVTTPAFMYDTKEYHLIYDGVGNMVRELLRLI